MCAGLDSATTFSVTKWLRVICHALQLTTVVSLLQPSPEVFQLFDDVLLLTDGYAGREITKPTCFLTNKVTLQQNHQIYLHEGHALGSLRLAMLAPLLSMPILFLHYIHQNRVQIHVGAQSAKYF